MSETREHYITGIREILTALGTDRFHWCDLGLGASETPVLYADECDDNITYRLDAVTCNGAVGAYMGQTANWKWDELGIELIETIYNRMHEYEIDD